MFVQIDISENVQYITVYCEILYDYFEQIFIFRYLFVYFLFENLHYHSCMFSSVALFSHVTYMQACCAASEQPFTVAASQKPDSSGRISVSWR